MGLSLRGQPFLFPWESLSLTFSLFCLKLYVRNSLLPSLFLLILALGSALHTLLESDHLKEFTTNGLNSKE
jgi:hypothetical protein